MTYNAETTTLTEGKVLDLLNEAIASPGTLSACYSQFHDYSLLNQLWAMMQCNARGIEFGPMRTFHGWKKLGRHVKRGESALELCRPDMRKFWCDNCTKGTVTEGDEKLECPDCNGRGYKFEYIAGFLWENRWFVLSQTDGEDVEFPPTEGWEPLTAVENLGFEIENFKYGNGNAAGYANHERKAIGLNPVADHPLRTLIHELAHLLIHDRYDNPDGETVSRQQQEIEAEGTSFVVAATLQVEEGESNSRGYIQHWLSDGEITDDMAQTIFAAANQILRAGGTQAKPRRKQPKVEPAQPKAEPKVEPKVEPKAQVKPTSRKRRPGDKAWRQTKPGTWLRKATISKTSNRDPLKAPFTASEGAFASDGFRLHFVPNFAYGEDGNNDFPLDACQEFLTDGKKRSNTATISAWHLRAAVEAAREIGQGPRKTRPCTLRFTPDALIVSAKGDGMTNQTTIIDGEDWGKLGIALYSWEYREGTIDKDFGDVEFSCSTEYLLNIVMGMGETITIKPDKNNAYFTDGEREAVLMGMHIGR